jgi:hypothetical protein
VSVKRGTLPRMARNIELYAWLFSVEEQLGALEDAVKHMVEDPARFGLRPSTAYQRQVEVENLRFQTTELQRSFDGVTTPKGAHRYWSWQHNVTTLFTLPCMHAQVGCLGFDTNSNGLQKKDKATCC